MKKRILSACIALTCVVLGAAAQRSYTFNAAALNVDGLPNSILGIEINPDGKEEAGATELCGILANSGWDIVGFSEDFNFHSNLVAAPASNYYNFGEHGGKVQSTSNSTDGLGFACAKRYTMSGGTRVKWSSLYGGSGLLNVGDNGADGMIDKGFRAYTVTLGTGVAVDVYVLHMDANTADSDDDYYDDGRDKNIVAREDQLKQLADYIKNNHNNRPVIILGDTNCRYTREQVKTGFIDYINADSRFTIKDAWVELIWDGVYPTYGAGAMMTDAYGAQRGEVVDKVFYINTTESNLTLKANSYLHDTDVRVSDHYPVVVNFTLTDPNGTPVNQELEGVDETVETWTDAAPTNPTAITSGTTYYLRNVHSGLFLKGGMNWGSHIGEGVDGMPITMTLVSGNTYKLSSSVTNCVVGTNLYTDNGDANAGNWTIEEIKSTSNKGNSMTKYIVKTGSNAIASSGNGSYADFAAYNKADTKQQWVLYTAAQMKAAIKAEAEATLQGAQYNASGLITLPVCCHENESRQSAWTKTTTVAVGGRGGENNAAAVWEVFRDNASHAFDFNQTVSGLPNGTYTVKVQAFFRDGDLWTSSKNVEPVFYAGNKETNICSILDYALSAQPWYADHKNGAGWIPNNMWQANQWFKAGYYTVTLSNVTVNDGTLKIGIKNTSTATSQAWCCFDNFQLIYHGTAEGDLRTSALYKRIKAAADEAIATVQSLNSAEATAAFDISNVAYRYNNNLVSADGAWELAAIENAVMTAVKSQTSKGADLSLAIVNPSFETGNLTGWTVLQSGWDTGANSGQDATGMDGEYLFNTWAGDTYGCGIIYQDVTGLRNGHYRLQAMVTSWADRKAYIVANDQHVGVATTAGEGVFVDLALDFLVEDGTARIGAVGGNENGEFNYKQGIFYKTDNFRLTYMGSTGEGRVKIALADAKAMADKLHEGAKTQFNNAVAQYESASVSGDGKAEEAAIYNALKAAITTQPRTETDMTWMITNPGFETGDWTGWTKPEAWDAVVLHATHGNAPGNSEGQYVVNVWNDQAGIEGSGVNKPTYQTLKGLPNGRYRLTAKVTSDGGNQVTAYATVNGNHHYVAASPENNATFVTSTVEFDVTGGADVTIGAVGLRSGEFNVEGGCWYKCDNFRLTYLGHEGTLDESTGVTADDWYTSLTVNRNVKAGVWNTFVVPFDMAIPEGWTVKALTGSELKNDNITLIFTDVDAIEAGVPYMVRTNEAVDAISTENVQVSTVPANANATTDHVEFVGVYEAGNIPTGAFFISDNTFYEAADESNTIKAFRAYIQPTVANARSISYRTDDETTDIEPSTLNAPSPVIYDLMGRRVTTMVKGIYIVNGRKVVVK